jgi:acyl-CoA synthetase (AMP-forming)/AMP-acid ligase II
MRMNIVEPILFQARHQPEAPALCAQGDDVVSYARLCAQMNNVARRARSFGLRRGNIVALAIVNPLHHTAVILGLTQVGIIPVTVGPNPPPAGLRIDAVIKNTFYDFAPAARHLQFDFTWITGESAPIDDLRHSGSEGDDICRIVMTSGTTGEAKAVALTHNIAIARIARFDFLTGRGLPRSSRVYLNMPIGSARGYYSLTYVLGRGGTLFFRGDSLEDTLRSFEIFRVEAMMATPNTLAQLLNACDRFPGIEVRFDTIITGGSQLPQALLERAWPRLCTSLVTVYGATETALAATAPAPRIAHIPGAVGYVAPGVRIEIVDQDDNPLPDGTEGIVRIASECGVDRYIDDAEESAKVFRDGWFYPGDIGSLTLDRVLIISGRQRDLLNIGGGKMAAAKIEADLLSYRGVSAAAVFSATNRLGVDEVWAAIVSAEPIDSDGLRAYCRTRLPPIFVPVHIVPVDALAVNEMGKLDRARIKQDVLAAAIP